MNFHYVSPGAMQPADDNDFIADLHSVQALHVRRKHFDRRIGRALATLPGRVLAAFQVGTNEPDWFDSKMFAFRLVF
jgi:hypothetical protein